MLNSNDDNDKIDLTGNAIRAYSTVRLDSACSFSTAS